MPALGLALLALLAPALVLAAEAPAFPYAPDPASPGAADWDGTAWTIVREGVTLRLEPLDDAARRAFIRRTTGSASDPFASAPGSRAGFAAFVLTVGNHSSGVVVFESQACRMGSGLEDERPPLDLAAIESAYRSIDQDVPAVFRDLRPLLFEGTLLLPAGQEARGLLVFRAPPEPVKRLHVTAPITRADGSITELKAAYRKRKR